MLGHATFNALDHCYRSAADAEEFEIALEHLAHAFGARGCSIVRPGAASRLSTPASPLYKQFLNQFVADGWAPRDLRAQRGWPQLKLGKRVLIEHDVVSDEERSTLAVYRDLYTHHDLYWWATVRFAVGSDVWALSFLRSKSADPFGRKEAEELETLAPDMARLVRLRETFAKARATDLVSILGAIGEPGIVVADDLTVLAIGDQACVELEPEFQLRQGRLVANSQDAWDVAVRLRSLVREVETGSPRLPLVLRRDAAGRRPLLLDVIRLAAPNDYGPLALVRLKDMDKRGRIDRVRLQDVFQLSQAEVKLAILIAEGTTLDSAAREIGVGRETARSQLKALFEKTGCRRQADLAVLLLQAGVSGP